MTAELKKIEINGVKPSSMQHFLVIDQKDPGGNLGKFCSDVETSLEQQGKEDQLQLIRNDRMANNQAVCKFTAALVSAVAINNALESPKKENKLEKALGIEIQNASEFDKAAITESVEEYASSLKAGVYIPPTQVMNEQGVTASEVAAVREFNKSATDKALAILRASPALAGLNDRALLETSNEIAYLRAVVRNPKYVDDFMESFSTIVNACQFVSNNQGKLVAGCVW